MQNGATGKTSKAERLAEAERRVPEVNALIDRQRQLIEELELHGARQEPARKIRGRSI